MKDKVIFNGEEFEVESGLTEAQIREGMEEMYPAIAHARSTKEANGDGSFTWRFAEVVGTKG